MRKIIFFLPLLLCTYLLEGQALFQVAGNAPALTDGDTLVFAANYPINSYFSFPQVGDTAIIQNGRFKVILKSNSAEFYIITLKRTNGDEEDKRIFLQPSDTKITINNPDLSQLEITGNQPAKDFIVFDAQLEQIKAPALLDSLFNAYYSLREKNSAEVSGIGARIDSILKIVNNNRKIFSEQWVNDHPHSLLNAFIIYYFLMPFADDSSLKNLYSSINPIAQKNSWGKELSYIIENVTTGVQSPSFTQGDTSGNAVTLTDFLGKTKYILLDFWASWCGPCRKNNPALKGLYVDYKDKGFTIIGISLDSSAEKWKEAIVQDGLTWPQISDLKFWKNEIAQAYYIRQVPYNYLLDTDGKIVAKNMSPSDLQELLEKKLK